jgi:hypothetical protein
MEIIEFRKIYTNDIYDHHFNDGYAWSRIYEYALVLERLQKYSKAEDLIHNSSWGYEGVHIKFKEKLDSLYNAEHSDIRFSNLPKTFVYNILEKSEEMKDKYDIVINISTLEEVGGNHIEIFYNLLDQVKTHGYLICTFDLPGLQIDKFEKLFNKSIESFYENINGSNSQLPNKQCENLNVGLMVIKK